MSSGPKATLSLKLVLLAHFFPAIAEINERCQLSPSCTSLLYESKEGCTLNDFSHIPRKQKNPGPFFPPLCIWKNWFIKLRSFPFWFPDWERTHFIWHTFGIPCYAQLERLSEANLFSVLKGKGQGECTSRVLLFEGHIMWPLHYLVTQVMF